MLGVNLCKSEYLRVGKRTTQLLLYIVEILDFFGRQGKSLFFVVFLKVVNTLDWFWIVLHCKDGLIETVIHALEHRIVVGIL